MAAFDAKLLPSQVHLFGETLDLLAKKLAEDEKVIGVEFPHVTRPDGSWQTYPASWSAGYGSTGWTHGHWTCGYWVGLLLAAHLRTGDEKFLKWARERMQLVAPRARDPNTHDIGFIFDGSAIPGFHVTGDAWYAELAMQAAAQLRSRIVATKSGFYLSSWGPNSDERGRTSSAIDTMGNLSLLYWAANHGGDGSFRLAAQAHADHTKAAFIRDDHSSYHAVQYDANGVPTRRYTFQGYGDESAWSRGQGWAIYGYVHTARETAQVGYLDLAEKLAGYYLQRAGGESLPPWDFDDPSGGRAPRDSAAAAIVAAALVELADLHPSAEKSAHWRSQAVRILEGLCTDHLARDRHRGLLRHGCYSKPHSDGIDSATMFGDFYFVEALCKLLLPGRFRPRAPRVDW